MASRYERIFLLSETENNPTCPVEILAGAIINDVLTQEKSIQLKFQIKGAYPAKKVVFDVVEYDINGQFVSQFPLTYEFDMQPNIPLGSDVITPFEDTVASSFTISVKEVVALNSGWSVDRGYFELPLVLTIFRDKQFFLVNPDIKVSVDGNIIDPLRKNGMLELVLPRGLHELCFKCSIRETCVRINICNNCQFTVSFNRTTGKLDIVNIQGTSVELTKHV